MLCILTSIQSNPQMKEQLGVSTGEFQSLNQQLSEAQIKLAVIETLVDINELLKVTLLLFYIAFDLFNFFFNV